jgi:DNA-binding transcriptional MocR family regulator
VQVLAKMLHTEGWFLAHVTCLQTAMRERCLALLAAARRHLQDVGASWTVPQAGMFLWVQLGTEREPSQLIEEMRRIGVAVQPGENCAVAPPPAGHKHIRLTYVIDCEEYEPALLKVKELIRPPFTVD